MIKTSTTLLFLVLSFIVNAQIVNIPDANFKKALVDNTEINTDGDTEISESEAAAFTKRINIGGLDIYDLTGIEYFINITSLWCSINRITNLDLTNNTVIKELDCLGNQLTVLNITKNTELERLYCTHNQLMELNLIENTKLKWLDCGYNQLLNLELNKNVELTYINCSYNNLTSLNINSNLKLTSLYCNDNKLTSLNVSSHTELQVLYCYDNYLTSLDISQNPKLNLLNCRDNKLPFTELIKIKEYYPNLNISYSKQIFTSLEKFVDSQVDYSAETLINNQETVFKWYLKNGYYIYHEDDKYVDNEYVNEETTGVFTFLKPGRYYCEMTNPEFKNLTITTEYIDIYNNQNINIPDANFKEILIENSMINLDSNNEITELEAGQYTGHLDLSNQNISDLTGIENFLHITDLDCSGNQLKDLDISNIHRLRKFDCSNNQLDDLKFSNSYYLNSFNCSHNNLRGIDFESARMLTEINCSNNKLNELIIKDNYNIVEIDCSNNEIENIRIFGGPHYLKKINFNSNRLNFTNLSLLKRTDADLIQITKQQADDVCLQYPSIPEVHAYINTEIDYSSEHGFEGKATKFRWINSETSSDVEENTVAERSAGIFKFIKEGKFYCEMTNEAFPDIVVYSSLVVASLKKQQIISFQNMPEVVSMYDVVELNAISSSGLEVNIEVIEGDVTIKDNTITFNKEETVIIKAIQKGNDEYAPSEKIIEIQVDYATGIEAILESSTQIYPNPVESEMVIKFGSSEERTIRIFDLQGRLKLEKETTSNSELLNLSKFKSGMYVMRVQSANGSFTHKIIKK